MTALAPPATDPRVEAFRSPLADVAFSTVVHPGGLWRPDPLDIESIHADAREVFAKLLHRATDAKRAEHGKIFVIRGTAGSGKTHLMRAFRHAAHAAGGYSGYLQMVSQSSDYLRYVLSYLIDSLDRPYLEPTAPGSGLVRLARGVLDAIPGVTDGEKRDLCQRRGEESAPDPRRTADAVNRLADLAVQGDRFDARDLHLVRALLYLLPPDGRLKSRVMMWLRCEEMTPADRELIGGLPASPADEALRRIAGLGRVVAAAQSAPLVLLVDQLEETFDPSDGEAESGRRFRQAVDALVNVATHVPNGVVVVACLDTLYGALRDLLPTPKRDRLEKETAPVTLSAHRSVEEVETIIARRLEYLCDELGVEPGTDPLAPFRREHLAPLAGQTIRNVLLFVHEHHRLCRAHGGWVEPLSVPIAEGLPPAVNVELSQMWNDYLAVFKPSGLDDEAGLAALLEHAVEAASAEFPVGVDFTADCEGRFLAVSVNAAAPAGGKLFVAVCDKGTQGGGLGRQVSEAVTKSEGLPLVLARSDDFPKDPKTKVVKDILASKGRRVVVSDSDWRAMAAFRAFHARHGSDDGFDAWQQSDRPLSGLPALQKILALDTLKAAAPAPPTPPTPPVGVAKPTPQPTPAAAGGAIRLGVSRAATPAAIDLSPIDLCRHAAFLGGSGSGKTTAALTVIEQLLLAGVPAVLIDRKGDLARYADPEAWDEHEPDPARAARRAELRGAIEVTLYTPGGPNGRPLAIPVVPDLAGLPHADREQLAQYAAAGLAQMMGYRDRGGDCKFVILQKAIEVAARAATPGTPVTARGLQALVADMDEALLAETDGFDAKHFKRLGEDLLTLSIRHRRLLEEGETLDIDALLGRTTPGGKTRLAVVNTQSLGDAGTVDFWVAQFLAAFDRWRAKNPSPGLQAVILLDEANVYLPAVGKPAAKGPLESLLRRGRSAGLGVFLATQSPGDLDYKGRDQILTWLLGRVKEPTAIAKLKPMLERNPAAADKLAHQATGEFYVVREGGVTPIRCDLNLVPTAQIPEERVLALARAQVAAGRA